MPNRNEIELINKAKEILNNSNISFEKVYVYVGCSENCGKMPRVIVRFKNEKPICFHLDELKIYAMYGNIWKLWIDDEAYDEDKPQRNPTKDYFVATTINEAIEITNKQKSPPFFLHLDHDLGEGGRVIDYLKWLYEKYPKFCPDYLIHSENCIGRLNIISYIDSWRKSLDM